MGPDGSDIFDEGLMIPPVKLVEAGRVNALVLSFVKANSRTPVANEGDIYALIASCDVGAGRLAAMMTEFGLEDLEALGAFILATSQRAAEAEIAKLPQGTYRHELRLDGYDFEIDLKAALTIAQDRMTVDFAGSSGLSRFGINVPLNYAAAYSVFGLRCLVGPDIPNNWGSLLPFQVRAPENAILNALSPAPVAMRHVIGQILPDLVLGCLHQALPGQVPAEGASCMWDLPLRSAPLAAAGTTAFAIELTHNGGTGARPGKDGLSATAYPSGVWGSQVEMTESVAPLRILRRELRPDSGGAGRTRGGLGQILVLESSEEKPIHLFAAVERMTYPALGRDGGQPGAAGRIALASGKELKGKGEQVIPAGDRLIFETPGGGGYGDPAERPRAAIDRDLAQGLITAAAAARDYGVQTAEPGSPRRRKLP